MSVEHICFRKNINQFSQARINRTCDELMMACEDLCFYLKHDRTEIISLFFSQSFFQMVSAKYFKNIRVHFRIHPFVFHLYVHSFMC